MQYFQSLITKTLNPQRKHYFNLMDPIFLTNHGTNLEKLKNPSLSEAK
jgi:hypothetical protein